MPVYEYRREDGTTFEIRQKFSDDPLTMDPATGQRVVRVVHAAGIVFKGSGFYVNDSKSKSSSAIGTPKSEKSDKAETTAKSEKADSSDSKPAATATESAKPAASPVGSAAD